MTIMEVGAEIRRQSGAKADYLVDTRRLEMEASGNGVVMKMLGDGGADAIEPMDVRQIAHRQIGTHLKIPATYYDRMLAGNTGLLAQNVNSWFRREPVRRMLRTLDGSARAFLSDRYRCIDNFEILQAVLPIIGEIPDARFESCQITESKMYIKVINPRLQTEVSVGDVVQAGVMISNSEVGQGAVSVQPLILRLVCMNGMVINDASTRRNHVGRVNASDENFLLYSDKTLVADDRAFMLKIQDTVRAAVDEAVFGRVVDMMREASGARMNTNDIPAIVKLASKDYGLTDSEGDGVLNHLIEDHNFTLYGLANAVTRHSQDIDSYDRATVLEGVGYEMLAMDPQRWNRLNRVPLQAAA
jgi:hypothetical protein